MVFVAAIILVAAQQMKGYLQPAVKSHLDGDDIWADISHLLVPLQVFGC